MKTVHYGIRPSGLIHLGNAVTAVYGLKLLDKPDQEQRLVVTVNDWDGSNPQGSHYDFGAPFMLIADGREARQRSLENFQKFLEEVACARGIRLQMLPASQLFKTGKAKSLFEKLCENGTEIFDILESAQDGVPIFPLDEKTGRYAFKAYYKEGMIEAVSKDVGGKESYFTCSLDPGPPLEMPIEVKLAVKHALLDDVDLFILGGNYPAFTIEKVKRIERLLGYGREYAQAPVVFVGKRVMSKSRNNIVALDDLLSRYSPSEIYGVIGRAVGESQLIIQAQKILDELMRSV